MKKIAVGLFGFGRTGSVVANELIKNDDIDLCWVVRKSNKNQGEYSSTLLGHEHKEGEIFSIQNMDFDKFYKENKVDVIIDFSHSCSVKEYKNSVLEGIRIVSAVSNYSTEEFSLLHSLSEKTAVLYSPNITLGINFLIEVSKMLKKVTPYADIEIVEEHFREKKDVSGTALRIAKDLGLDPVEHVNSVRVGGVVGTHEVIFGLPNQTIRIKHESLNRAAFGQGAIYAAKWIMNKNRNMYSMEEAITTLMTQ